MTEITPKLLADRYTYNAETGLFFFKKDRGRQTFKTNHSNGYFVANVLGKTIYAHRAAWAIQTGDWPEGVIDHVNGDKKDNRWENLRDVSSAQNQRNMRKSIVNKSGYVGVYRKPGSRLWTASISSYGRSLNLGSYETAKEAALVRLGAQKALGFQSRHGGLEDELNG